MKKIILVYGLISGAIVIASMIFSLAVAGDGNHIAALQWAGYLIMIVALTMIFVGIKRYRDQTLGGVIRFGTAFLLGLGISAVAGVVYVAVWEVNLAITDHAFIHEYAANVIDLKKEAGINGEALDAVVAEMDEMKENYAKPWFRLPMTFMEIFPVGLLISLISAAVLRNQKVLPA